MGKKELKEEKILHELYRRSFKASEPSADWDELLENATINEEGQKEIPFMDYECEQEILENIFNDVMKEYKIAKHKRKSYSITFYLGCSPKTKLNQNQ